MPDSNGKQLEIPTRPTKLDVLFEGAAVIIRERTRHPSGGTRISPDLCREIAYQIHEYWRSQGLRLVGKKQARQFDEEEQS